MWRTVIDLRTIIELGQLPADVRLCHAELQLEQLLVDVLVRNVEVPRPSRPCRLTSASPCQD
jgi:hypothetical protein